MYAQLIVFRLHAALELRRSGRYFTMEGFVEFWENSNLDLTQFSFDLQNKFRF